MDDDAATRILGGLVGLEDGAQARRDVRSAANRGELSIAADGNVTMIAVACAAEGREKAVFNPPAGGQPECDGCAEVVDDGLRPVIADIDPIRRTAAKNRPVR